MTKEKAIGNIYIQAAGLVQQLESAIFSSSRVRFNKKFENALDDRITGLMKAHCDFAGVVNPLPQTHADSSIIPDGEAQDNDWVPLHKSERE